MIKLILKSYTPLLGTNLEEVILHMQRDYRADNIKTLNLYKQIWPRFYRGHILYFKVKLER